MPMELGAFIRGQPQRASQAGQDLFFHVAKSSGRSWATFLTPRPYLSYRNACNRRCRPRSEIASGLFESHSIFMS